MSNKIYFSTLAALGIILSQVTGYYINKNIPLNNSKVIWGDLMFTHIRNEGMVFGWFQGAGWYATIFSILVVGGLVFYIFRSDKIQKFEYICFGLITGGAISNILDRFIYGSVIDFINVNKIVPDFLNWTYIFNTADVLIHLGLWPMIIGWVITSYKQKKNAEA